MKFLLEEKELEELKNKILDSKIVSKKDLESILHYFSLEQISQGTTCQPLLIKTTGDSIRERDFLKILLQHVVFFVLDFEEYKKKGMDEIEFIKKISQLFVTAKNKFQEDNKKTGEVGELILFMLLEANNITQIVSKMRLKTNRNMPVHGPDAVHVEIKEGNLVLHFGEAKMYQDFNSAIDSALDSVSKVESGEEEFEFDIIKKYIDESKFGIFTSKILDYLDPYYVNKENMLKTNPVFVGYDWKILQNLNPPAGQTLSEYIQKEFKNSLQERFSAIRQKIENSDVSSKSFSFFILPFRNVNDFRKQFLEMIK